MAAAAAHSGWLADPLQEGINAERKCPLMIVSGTDDVQVPPDAAEELRAAFREEGHAVEFWMIDGLSHRWADDHDVSERIWKFLSRHALEPSPD